MKYIVCEKPGEFLLKQKGKPDREPNEALLQINKVGICGTDLHAFMGTQAFFTYPRVLGHELAAQVLEVGPNSNGINVGDKVVVMPYVSCGKCVACKKDKSNCCSNISVLGVHSDGGMQEQIVVPVSLLIAANHMSYDQLSIIEPLAIGAHAIRRAAIQPGETIVVIGCGPIGIGIMKLAQIAGLKVIALDLNENRLNYAKNVVGIDHIINVQDDPVKKILEITSGDMASVVFDASGNKFALETGPSYMSHGGKFVLVGLFNGDISYNHPAIHAKEITLLCSRNEYVIGVIDQFPTDDYITHNVSYTKMIETFEKWLHPEAGVIKATIDFKI